MRTPRTLVVEDNWINMEVASRLLSGLGHQVDFALSGEAALRVFTPGKYQLVLMDCHMPVLDGFQTTIAIREHEAASGAKPVCIIALTADTRPECREKCFAAGMNDFLTKPISMDAFREAVARSLPEDFRELTEEDPGFDTVVLDELSRMRSLPGEPNPLDTILDAFLTDTPTILQRFNTAVRREDHQAIQTLGRMLQSACSNLGVRRINYLCSEILTRSTAAPGLLPLLNKECASLFIRLREMRAESELMVSGQP